MDEEIQNSTGSKHRIGIIELLVILVCILIYVVGVEYAEDQAEVARQGQIVQQEQGFLYQPPESRESGGVRVYEVESDNK